MIIAVIDTHALIWYLYDDIRLSQSARSFLETTMRSDDQVAVSSITFIEMVYLIEKSRIPVESLSILAGELTKPTGMFVEAPVDLKIARALSHVNVQQVPDMPDRIIAATALAFQVPVISRDGKIRLSSINTIW